MEKRRSINTKFWDDAWVSSLTPEEKLLFLYILTSPLSNLLGIYEITLKRISYDTGLSNEKILKYLKGFDRIRKVIFFNDWIVILNHIKNQSFNPKMESGAKKLFDNIPNFLKDKLKEYDIIGYDTLSNGIYRIEQKEEEEEVEKEGKRKRKKEGEEEKKFIPPTLDEVKIYFDLKGYTEEGAIKAFNHYESLNWFNSLGKKVTSWKNTMVNNWFEEKFKKPVIPKQVSSDDLYGVKEEFRNK